MTRFGANAANNTWLGLRNENSTLQYVAASGSEWNQVKNGGTFFTGRVTNAESTTASRTPSTAHSTA